MISLADDAVAYVIDRIRHDPRLAYYFGYTEALKKLTAAYAQAQGRDHATFHAEFTANLITEEPRCRSGRCAKEDM